MRHVKNTQDNTSAIIGHNGQAISYGLFCAFGFVGLQNQIELGNGIELTKTYASLDNANSEDI